MGGVYGWGLWAEINPAATREMGIGQLLICMSISKNDRRLLFAARNRRKDANGCKERTDQQ
jgi:hypothetical protein